MSVALKSFRYALDGFTVVQAREGDDIDFGHLTDGLVAAKLVEGGKAKPVDVKPVEQKPVALAPEVKPEAKTAKE